jgi:hypothetical protein
MFLVQVITAEDVAKYVVEQAKLTERDVVHCNGNLIYVFLFWELRGLSPNFHIICL